MGVETYGVFGALFSLSFFLQFILLRSVTVIDAQFISKFKGQNNFTIIPIFHRKIQIYMTGVGLVSFLIFSLLSVQIASFLRIDSVLVVLLVGVLFLFCWPLSVNCGTIQGLQRFNQVALMSILPALFRFIISVGLVLIGYGLYGAVWGLVLGTVVALLTSFYLLRDIARVPRLRSFSKSLSRTPPQSSSDVIAPTIDSEIGKAFRFSIPVLFAVVCIAVPTNIDVVLIKHFFSSGETGLYTAVSMFGRVIFSIPIAIVTVMYPMVVEAHAQKSETKDLLKRSLLYTGLPAGILAILFYVIPKFFLGLFYGNEYIEGGPFLQLYGIFIFFFSLTTVLLYNSLAKNRYGFVYLFAAFSILEIGLILVYHDSISRVLQIFLIISVITFIIGFYLNCFYSEKNQRVPRNAKTG